MGLDISAYSRLTPAPAAALDENGTPIEPGCCMRIRATELEWVEQHFPGRTRGLQAGVFAFADILSFHAGSYSGYNFWRDALARFAYYDTRGLVLEAKSAAEFVWQHVTDGPFYELINFADNEGVIGPVCAAKLAKDFADYQDRANPYAKMHPVWLGLYGQWRRAFELAADGGAVRFH
jgi:hypothetical protein